MTDEVTARRMAVRSIGAASEPGLAELEDMALVLGLKRKEESF